MVPVNFQQVQVKSFSPWTITWTGSLIAGFFAWQQKVVVKVSSMSDERVKQKAMETVADIYGIDSIAADHKDQKMTVIGDMDSVVIAKKLRKFGRIDILSVGPAKEEKKDDKKAEKK